MKLVTPLLSPMSVLSLVLFVFVLSETCIWGTLDITHHGFFTGTSTFADMETVVRRCPFLSRVPQAFLQKAGKSLLFYAQNCPKMMEVGAKPAPRTLSTSAAHCQQIRETPPANESK